ncbi:hypothetical protein [Burkholderia gladioli]|uniref:hypothetical protein n=1 Tax=Burkholderia gladioli TaxID=28095 RepID=UPI00163EA6DD|nr:hypothetical protein [Burkholderia gladioli]
MLELTNEQVAELARIDARGYVDGIRADLVAETPALASDTSLPTRLWNAYVAARRYGIESDDNVAAFLRTEAYAPQFYDKPAFRAWVTRPGRSPDERFHDYLRVMKWRIEHQHDEGGSEHGGISGTGDRRGSGGARTGLGASWNRLIGRSRGSGNG